jgi:hypothetical protein
MYTKEDVIKFGTYLLSEARAKKIEATIPHNDTFVATTRTVTEADFEAVWPIVDHELSQEDIDANEPITDEDGTELVAGDIVGIPTDPNDLLDASEKFPAEEN